MKLLLILVLSIICIGVTSTSYIGSKIYQNTDNNCDGILVEEHYVTSGACMGNIKQECEVGSNSITSYAYNDDPCSNESTSWTNKTNECVKNVGLYYEYEIQECVASIPPIPNKNVYINVNQESCSSNWKDDFISLLIYYVDQCYLLDGYYYYSTCNETALTEKFFYQSEGTMCNSDPYQVVVTPFEKCDSSSNPYQMICL